MIVAGRNAVTEALQGNLTIEKIVVAKELNTDWSRKIVATAKQRGIKVSIVPRETMDKMSPKHQGIFAVTTEFRYTPLEELLSAPSPKLLVVLDGVEDPHNLGAVIRVADCTGATGVVVPKHRGTGVTDTVVRTSAGATAHVAVSKVTNLNDAVRAMKEAGIFVFAADMGGESVYRANLTGDIAIIIGGEGNGVHALTKKLADGVISLPQLGKVNSLNASVAAGALLYEAVRQRLAK